MPRKLLSSTSRPRSILPDSSTPVLMSPGELHWESTSIQKALMSAFRKKKFQDSRGLLDTCWRQNGPTRGKSSFADMDNGSILSKLLLVSDTDRLGPRATVTQILGFSTSRIGVLSWTCGFRLLWARRWITSIEAPWPLPTLAVTGNVLREVSDFLNVISVKRSTLQLHVRPRCR